ncbi:MAG: hypothetical protein M0D55_09560 [Elusimicrobiota bacterium]|nr:MAG: hypothetical protein M0D55_09560 [Elusimicrobiota bacterium]
MKNVFEIRFSTNMSMEEMLAILRVGKIPLEWSMRESEYEGDYIKGTTADHIKVRVIDNTKVDAEGRFGFEVYFPSVDSECSENRKSEFLDFVRKTIFPLIRANEL